MKKVGFTGTRNKISREQYLALAEFLDGLGEFELHHGDCVGADAEAHEISTQLPCQIIIHPPIKKELRAFCSDAFQIRETQNYFARNRQIVLETELLVACPRLMNEEREGGTWYTINYARKLGRKIYIIWPDGSIAEEN